MKPFAHVLWAAAVACGCLDLNLLDNMHPTGDGGVAESGQSGKADTSGQTGPPAKDPADSDPPALNGLACDSGESESSGLCVASGTGTTSLRFATAESATVTVEVSKGQRALVLSESWSTEHHAVVVGLDEKAAIAVRMTDVNGNAAKAELETTSKSGVAVAITEVLADPNGTEPDQEFVELVNYGDSSVDIGGWMIDDCGDKNGDLVPDNTMLEPGQTAILVGPDFDPKGAEDPAPAAGTLIVSLSSSIGSSGLKNSDAESVELYDRTGTLVSQYKGQAGKPKPGVSASRLCAELPDGDPLAFVLDPSGNSTPGTATRVP